MSLHFHSDHLKVKLSREFHKGVLKTFIELEPLDEIGKSTIKGIEQFFTEDRHLSLREAGYKEEN